MTDPEVGFIRLLEAFDRLEIPYMVAGSTASSVHGMWRATQDVDFVARIRAEDVDPLVEELQSEFYIDADQIRSAIENRRSFNVIHFESSYKFDVFPLSVDAFQQAQFGRRKDESFALFGKEPIEFTVASPEDVILSKLVWYRRGGETSSQQWNDILGVLAVRRNELDNDYLRRWAEQLKVTDLLGRAIEDSRGPG